jgi:D-hexose-6-phosphate mutarotase
MPDDDYQKFICVENGQTEQIPIAGGGSWQSSVTITAGGMEPGAARL